jgi:uncharacterized phiE125 gp8 family phage protein
MTVFRNRQHQAARLDPVRVVPPVGHVVSLEDAKAHLRRDDTTYEDALIFGLIDSVVGSLDGWGGTLRRALLTQTWSESFRYFDGLRIPLRLAPVSSIVSITYFDPDGVLRTFDASAYRLQRVSGDAYVELDSSASWPSVDARDDAATITYVCGYGDGPAVPAPIRQAILLMVGDLHLNREAAGPQQFHTNRAVEALLAPYRRGASNF